jgi:hypothetical protein
MLAKSKERGPVLLCDNCQTEITALGQALWKFDGQTIRSVLVVHDHCEESSLVKMLMPRGYHTQPLAGYLECLLEKLSV